MAYFQRKDEADHSILCNICNVNVKERRLTNHRSVCRSKNPEKFKSGQLVECKYNSNHIVEADKMSLHLEFCVAYQSLCTSEYQKAKKEATLALNDSRKPYFEVNETGTKEA